MDAIPPSDPSQYGMVESSPYRFSHDRLEEASRPGSSWYFSRKEIEENSPSRRDGIDLKKETYLRKSYCTYLQDLGMRLKVMTLIRTLHPTCLYGKILKVMMEVFEDCETLNPALRWTAPGDNCYSHSFLPSFFLRQSHLKNDRRTIATVCMFLAGKVEETPRPLKDVILVSYEVIHKKDPAAAQRIKQREVYEQQKELILLGERVVLATLGFDFNVHHPYKPLVEAIKKFKVAQNALAQVAWNFVNDGLRTSLCLQFKPHHIAAGAIFLAAKFLKVKLPSDGEKVWWQEFDVTPRQLEEVSNQMLELYEQNRLTQQSHGNETEGSSASGAHHHAPVKAPFPAEEPPAQNGYSQATKPSSLQHSVPSMLTHAGHEQSQSEKQNGTQRLLQNENNDYASNKLRSGPGDSKMEAGTKDRWHHDQGNVAGTYEGRSSRYESECPVEESTVAATGGSDGTKERTSNCTEGPKNFSPMMDAMKKIDKDKVKAALEKRRKSKGDVARKIDLTDEDDLIERELEHGVELAVEDEKIKQERRQSWSKTLYREGPKNSDHVTENGNLGHEKVTENTEEGELSMDSQDFRSPEPGSHKRKAMSPGKQFGGRDGYDAQHYNRAPTSNYHDGLDDARSVGRFERAEREHKRFRHES